MGPCRSEYTPNMRWSKRSMIESKSSESVEWTRGQDMKMLKRIRVAGWKSIKDQTIDLTPLTVVIGANGAGKSNLLSLFKLLNAVSAETPGFRNFVAQSGFADSLLHYGSKETSALELDLIFSNETD